MLPSATGQLDKLRNGGIVLPVHEDDGAYAQSMADTNDRVDIPPPPLEIQSFQSGEDPFAYSFVLLNDPPGHTQVVWEFGDGTGATAPPSYQVGHVYDDAGEFDVTATCHHETCETTVVVDAPVGYGFGPYGSGPYGGST